MTTTTGCRVTAQLLLVCGWLTTLRIPAAMMIMTMMMTMARDRRLRNNSNSCCCHRWFLLWYLIFLVVVCDHDPMTPTASPATHPSSLRTASTMTELMVVDNDPSAAGRLSRHVVNWSYMM